MSEVVRKVIEGFYEGYRSGTIARLINVTPETPIPANWLAQSETYKGPVPSDAPVIDCADAALGAAAGNSAPPPNPHLTIAELHKKIPALKDPAVYAWAVAQLKFPVGQRESAINKWLERTREQATFYAKFL
jgi:hypothetical protein